LSNDLNLHQFFRDDTGCASYLISSKITGKGLLIDPLTDTERYENLLKNQHLEVVGLIDTHTHADHLSGLRSFSSLYPKAVLAMHETSPAIFNFRKLSDGERLEDWIGSSTGIRVIYTPGHATDHICLLLKTSEPKLISGDCLFIGDVGRTDLGRGDNDLMYESLFRKLLSLDPRTEVYPAHIGAKHFLATDKVSTTIGKEKETNPALQVKSKEEFVKYMTEGWTPKPANYEQIININLGKASRMEGA